MLIGGGGDQSSVSGAGGVGGDLDTVAPDGWTWLTKAAIEGNEEAVALLLTHAADANRAQADGITPLYVPLTC